MPWREAPKLTPLQLGDATLKDLIGSLDPVIQTV